MVALEDILFRTLISFW